MSVWKRFAASDTDGCAAQFIILILLVAFVGLILSPDERETAATASLATSGTLQPLSTAAAPVAFSVVSTPVPAPGTPSFNCEPGIQVGGTVNVAQRAVRMRRLPGYVNKNDATDSLHYMEAGDALVVRGGPQIVDGLCWWLVEHQGFQGWAADHSQEGRLLLSINR